MPKNTTRLDPSSWRALLGARAPASRREIVDKLKSAQGPLKPLAQQAIVELERLDDAEIAAFLEARGLDVFEDAASAASRAREAAHRLQGMRTEPFRAAIASFSDVDMAPQDRRKLLDAAQGDPLCDAALDVLTAMSLAVPDGALPGALRRLDRTLHPDGKLRDDLAHAWWSPYVPRDVGAFGDDLEALRTSVHDPAFRGRLDQALDVLRVAARVEAHNLERIAVEFPQHERPAVRRALSRYLVGAATVALEAAFGTSAGFSEDVKSLADALLRVASLKEDGSLDGSQKAKEMQSALAEISDLAARIVDEGGKLAAPSGLARVPSSFDRRLVERKLGALSDELEAELDKRARTTPEGKAALRELVEDITASAIVLGNLAQMAGAVANPKMSPDERAERIKESAEDMGPVFVKLFQTLANQDALLDPVLEQYAGGDEGAAVVREALRKLQDRVTPMPFEDVRAQLRAELGAEVEELFSKLEQVPMASASIGQVHRATLGEGDRAVDVVVKVMRRGLEQEFDRTTRVARLTVAVGRESLRTTSELKGKDLGSLERLLEAIDSTLDSFIESFRIEMDFRHEAAAMQEFRDDVRARMYVTAPKVYPERTSQRILTMQLMRGEKLSSLLSRYAAAERAREIPLDTSPVKPGMASRADVEARARAWAEQTYGMTPKKVTSKMSEMGWIADVSFEHASIDKGRVHLSWDGEYTADRETPELSKKSLVELRDRLLGSFLAQMLVHGMLHGDLHQGNFLVLRDGKTLALLDFGNVIHLKGSHLQTALRLLWARQHRDSEGLARALLDMSEQGAQMGKKEKEKALEQLTRAFDAAHAAAEGPLDLNGLLGTLSTEGLAAGVSIAPVYTQTMKTAVSMWGNVQAFVDAGLGITSTPGTASKVALEVAKDAGGKMNPLAFLIERRKDARIERLNRRDPVG